MSFSSALKLNIGTLTLRNLNFSEELEKIHRHCNASRIFDRLVKPKDLC